jgi:phage repressor protein C with HTH and peptisase S24 domain
MDDGSQPSASLVERFARHTNRPEIEVRQAAGLAPADSAPPPVVNPVQHESLDVFATPVRYVRVARGAVGAGQGRIVVTEDALPLPADDWPSTRIVAVIVAGDCLEPEIRHGEYVFVDLDRTDAIAGELVVIVTDEGDPMVKRVELATSGLLLTDNKGGRFRPAEARIVGVVVGGYWKGRRR